MQKHSHPDVSA